MDDTPKRLETAHLDPVIAGEAELLTILAESEAEAEAGLFVSGDEVIRELHESIARMERRAAADHADAEPGFPRRR